MSKLVKNPQKNKKNLTILFVTWFLYSAGMLGYMALNDTTPSHCFVLASEINL